MSSDTLIEEGITAVRTKPQIPPVGLQEPAAHRVSVVIHILIHDVPARIAEDPVGHHKKAGPASESARTPANGKVRPMGRAVALGSVRQ